MTWQLFFFPVIPRRANARRGNLLVISYFFCAPRWILPGDCHVPLDFARGPRNDTVGATTGRPLAADSRPYILIVKLLFYDLDQVAFEGKAVAGVELFAPLQAHFAVDLHHSV